MGDQEDVEKTLHVDNSIHIGDGNMIKNSTIGGKAEKTPSKAKKTISQIIWQIVVPICVGVAVSAIFVLGWVKKKG